MTPIRAKPSPTSACALSASVGDCSSRKASAMRSVGSLLRAAAETRRSGAAHSGSRAPWAKRIRAVFDIGQVWRDEARGR